MKKTNREAATEVVDMYVKNSKYGMSTDELITLVEHALDQVEIGAYLNGFNVGKKEPKGAFSAFPSGMVEEVVRLGKRSKR